MSRDSAAIDSNTPGADNGASAAALTLSESRCKVCQSEHRAEIDTMLRRGDSQAKVRRHFNGVLGREFFKPNNLSVHTRKHLYGPDPADWIRKRASAHRILGDPNAIPSRPEPEDALRTVVEVGLSLIHAGVTVPETSDVIRAAKELKRIESEGMRATEEVMMREIKAFTTAVKNIVPEEQWAAILNEYKEILGQR